MRKKIKGLIVICVLLSIVFVVSGCSLLQKANAQGEELVEEQEVDALTRIIEMMKRREPSNNEAHYQKLQYDFSTLVRIGDVNYQINYRWKDINLDVLDYSKYPDTGLNSKEDIENNIALSEEQGYEWYISQLKDYSYENSEVMLNFDSVSNLNKEYKIFYNEGHNELIEENEVIIPKWLYFKLYCTTLEEIACDKEMMEQVLAEDKILQRDMFLGMTYNWCSNGTFSSFDSLVISLGYYGIIDTSSPKADMKIVLPEKFNWTDGYGDESYELSVVGYFETEVDEYFDKPLTEDLYNYDLLEQYLFTNTWVYFK